MIIHSSWNSFRYNYKSIATINVSDTDQPLAKPSQNTHYLDRRARWRRRADSRSLFNFSAGRSNILHIGFPDFGNDDRLIVSRPNIWNRNTPYLWKRFTETLHDSDCKAAGLWVRPSFRGLILSALTNLLGERDFYLYFKNEGYQ